MKAIRHIWEAPDRGAAVRHIEAALANLGVVRAPEPPSAGGLETTIDALVIHAPISEARAAAALHSPARRVILVGGRRDVGAELVELLRPRCTHTYAWSVEDADAFDVMGLPRVRSCPPVVDVGSLAQCAPDATVHAQLDDAPRPSFACACDADEDMATIIGADHLLVSRFQPDAQLYILGGDHDAPLQHVRRHVNRLNLPGAAVVGPIAPPQTAAFLDRVDAVVACPGNYAWVLSAMARGTPVICRDAGAVGELVRGAGIALRSDAGIRELTIAMTTIADRPKLRRELAALALERAHDRRVEASAGRLADAIGQVL